MCFSNSDTESGSCSTIINEHSDQYGKWRLHRCNRENAYMCKRPLSSEQKISVTQNSSLAHCNNGSSFFRGLQPSVPLAGWASRAAATGWSVTPTCWPPGMRPTPSVLMRTPTCWLSTSRSSLQLKNISVFCDVTSGTVSSPSIFVDGCYRRANNARL